MRPRLVALVAVVLLALFLVVPAASAQVPAPYAFGPTTPFYVPQAGVDPAGRPFALEVAGWYGPYDGFGYPVVVNTVGVYAGVPVARTRLGYVPAPFPVAPLAPYGPPIAVPLVP
jgi:hypothetical protein